METSYNRLERSSYGCDLQIFGEMKLEDFLFYEFGEHS
jgi:hypothetical protein